MVEQRPPKPKVVGSIPIMDAFFNLKCYSRLIYIWIFVKEMEFE